MPSWGTDEEQLKAAKKYRETGEAPPDDAKGAPDWLSLPLNNMQRVVTPQAEAQDFITKNAGQFNSGLPPSWFEQTRGLADAAGQQRAPAFDRQNSEWGAQEQMKLLAQIQEGKGKNTAAEAMGQKALNQSAHQAAKVRARGGGLSAMGDANDQAQGIVGQVGQGVAQEMSADTNRQVLLGTQGRAQDYQVRQAEMVSQMAQEESNNAMVRFYLAMGDDFQTAERKASLEKTRLYNDRYVQNMGKQKDTITGVAQLIGTVL